MEEGHPEETTHLLRTIDTTVIDDDAESWLSSSLPEIDDLDDSIRAPSHIASLDFETIVNSFSIEATRERFLMGPIHEDENLNDYRSGLETDGSSYDASNKKKKEFSDSVDIQRRHRPKQNWKGYTGRTFLRWTLVILTGVLTGMVTIAILVSTEYLVSFRLQNMNKIEMANRKAGEEAFADFLKKNISSEDRTFSSYYDQYLFKEYVKIFLYYSSLNLGLALASSAMCLFLAPEAAGSGIPEMIAYLNGVRVRKFTDFRLFVVKVLGTILSVSSSLVVGPEGPLVHLGAVIGASLTKSAGLERFIWMQRRFWDRVRRWLLCGRHDDTNDDDSDDDEFLPGYCCAGFYNFVSDLSHFRNDAERRDLITIGAAAGFAAAFGAPVGGVLFSMEEASTFFATNLLWKTLTATAAATFCVAVYKGDLSEYGVISLDSEVGFEGELFLDRLTEFPLYMLTGAVGGLLGAAFNITWKRIHRMRMRFFQRDHLSDKAIRIWKLVEVAVLSLFTSTVLFILPLVTGWSCKAPMATSHFASTDDDEYLTFDHRLDCPAAEVNELGVIFFGSREDAIKSILTNPENYDPRTLLTVALVFFPLMTLTFGVSLPSGIFMPTVLVGSALGGSAGIGFNMISSYDVSTSTFALLGAAALLAGIQRNVVSLCVILVEGTGQTKILIPVIVTVVVARYVGDKISHGVYHTAMEVKGYPYLDHHVRSEFVMFQVKEIMSSPVRCLHRIETVDTIERILSKSSHYGFPVTDEVTGRFLGLIRRDQLVALLQCGVFEESSPKRRVYRQRSVVDNPLHNLAFHIKDDRYNSIHSMESDGGQNALDEDDFDEHAWLVDNIMMYKKQIRMGLDDALPYRGKTKKNRRNVVVTKKDGKLIVFPDASERRLHVNIGAAMNQGVYSVIESCPVSKAYKMFTALGLRHLVVLGGSGGGDVVGILTRSNFDMNYMQKVTRCELGHR